MNLIFSIEIFSQSIYDPIRRIYFDKKELQKEIEKVLNVMINSSQIDSIYTSKKMYLSEDAIPYFDEKKTYIFKKKGRNCSSKER